MHEATILGSAIHWLQRRSSGDGWAAVLDAMQDAGLDLGAQGLSDAASTVVKLREDVASSRAASVELLGNSRTGALSNMPGGTFTDRDAALDSQDGRGMFIIDPEGVDLTSQQTEFTLPHLPRDPLYEGF